MGGLRQRLCCSYGACGWGSPVVSGFSCASCSTCYGFVPRSQHASAQHSTSQSLSPFIVAQTLWLLQTAARILCPPAARQLPLLLQLACLQVAGMRACMHESAGAASNPMDRLRAGSRHHARNALPRHRTAAQKLRPHSPARSRSLAQAFCADHTSLAAPHPHRHACMSRHMRRADMRRFIREPCTTAPQREG